MQTAFQKISLLDRYLIQRFTPPLVFSGFIFTVFGELIGISFEQIKFVATSSISMQTAVYVHLLKLPAFFAISLPLALLMASLITFSDLSSKNEITAFRTFGIGLARAYMPVLMVSLLIAGVMFVFQEIVVPPANLRAATLLEQEWNIDRETLAKYNRKDIVYLKHSSEKTEADLDFLFFARQFKNGKMKDVTLVRYRNNSLSEILVSEYAKWDGTDQTWKMESGHQYILANDGYYAKVNSFQELPVNLAKRLFDYVNDYRDAREMNILELYHRLMAAKEMGNLRHIRQLRISIQERYALPFSCLSFTFLGASIGALLRGAGKVNNFGLSTIMIFAYYALQFVSQSLAMMGAIPIALGVWIPNLLSLLSGYGLGKINR
jgi:lipopolysaccharide export system permease protein